MAYLTTATDYLTARPWTETVTGLFDRKPEAEALKRREELEEGARLTEDRGRVGHVYVDLWRAFQAFQAFCVWASFWPLQLLTESWQASWIQLSSH